MMTGKGIIIVARQTANMSPRPGNGTRANP